MGLRNHARPAMQFQFSLLWLMSLVRTSCVLLGAMRATSAAWYPRDVALLGLSGVVVIVICHAVALLGKLKGHMLALLTMFVCLEIALAFFTLAVHQKKRWHLRGA